MIEVSIIVPTFNSEKHVYNLNNSINNQTFKNFEVIIIDNYSSDETLNKLKKLNEFNKKFRFYKIKNEGSIAKSRNFGIDKSTGKYIAFHDSDDFWFPNKLEVCLKEINNKDFIYHDLRIKNIKNFFDKRKLYSYALPDFNSFENIMTRANPISTSSVLCKKLIFNKIKFSEDKKLAPIEDYDFYIKVTKNNFKFRYIKKVLGIYNIGLENTSRINSRNGYKYFYIYNSHKKFLSNNYLKILSKNNFRYLMANALESKKLKRKYFSFLLFSKILKSKVKILLKLFSSLY